MAGSASRSRAGRVTVGLALGTIVALAMMSVPMMLLLVLFGR